jgi:hypothetical protein
MNTINELKYNKLLIVALLVFSTLAACYPILGNEFLDYWDDQWQVFNQYTEGGINSYNIATIFIDYYHGQYSPVDELMYLLLYTIDGYNPTLFHLASLLLHAANACLVCVLVRRLFSNIRYIKEVSVVSALFFALHPLNVESVAWMSASKVLVYAFFYLLAAICYLRYMKNGEKRYYILTFLLFALSFGGKEQAVIFPVFQLLMYLIKGHNLKDKGIWLRLAPFFLAAIAFGLISMQSQRGGRAIFSLLESGYPLLYRIIFGSYALTEYLVKFFAPLRLLYIYPYPIQVGELLPVFYLVYPLLLSLLLILFYRTIKRSKIVCFGLLFFVVNLLLVLHIIPMSRFIITADRYMYLPMIGLGFLVSYYWVRYIKRHNGGKKTLAIAVLCGYLLFFGGYSNLRCRDWHDTGSIKKEMRDLLEQRKEYEETK